MHFIFMNMQEDMNIVTMLSTIRYVSVYKS